MPLHAQLLQFLFSGLTSGSIIALIAVGFVTVYNVTGVLNFSQGEFAMLGALLSVTLYRAGLPVPLAMLLATLAVMVLGGVFERVAIRPVRQGSVVTLIIITIGVSIILRGAALLLWGADPLTLPAFTAGPALAVGGASLVRQSLWVLGATLLVMGLLYLFMNRTVMGTALRACVINPTAARLVGIAPQKMAAYTFAITAGLGAVGGIVVTPITGATYSMGLMLGLKAFVAAVLGGLTSAPAAVAGGLLVGVLEAMAAGLISSGYKDAITFMLLLLILLARPQGIGGALSGRRV